MKYYNYRITRDYGFAPNPFGGVCTLATCKPRIRKTAEIGDWIIISGSKKLKCPDRIVCLMKVSNTLTFNEYWNAPEYQFKKPAINGSLVRTYGDNIYCHNGNEWIQANSHHSHPDGSPNMINLNRDTGTNRVLVAEEFYYFGRSRIAIIHMEHLIKSRGHKYVNGNIGKEIVDFVRQGYTSGLINDPINFEGFERYDGK